MIGKKYKLTKEEDLVFEGKHPNNINVGYEKEGTLKLLEKGRSMILGNPWNAVSTSLVKEIEKLDEGKIRVTTKNSVYILIPSE